MTMRTDDYSLIWKALAAPIRRQILDLLRERPYTTGELAQVFDVSRFAVMKHLTALEESGLLTVRKQGRERWNTLNPVPLQLIYERWMRPYEAKWSQSLLQLKSLVEGTDFIGENKVQKRLGESASQNLFNMISIQLEFTLMCSRPHVFDALTHNLTAWWGHPYVHQDATDIIIEPYVGGRLYEVWGRSDRGSLWATVSVIRQDQELCLVGPIGLPEPSHSVIKINLKSQEDDTLLLFSLEAFGKIDPQIQKAYEASWTDLLDVRLRAFVERDIRYGLNHGVHGWFEDDDMKDKVEQDGLID
jgi:DNA-binding transcriptional ArsR family regulator